MAEFKMPKYVYKDKTTSLDECYKGLAAASYQSPINIVCKEFHTKLEGDIFKAIRSYGVVVDKDELVKALQYDREQYEKGYADGLLHRTDDWISVDERLPESNKQVLVCYSVGKIDTAHYIRVDGLEFWFEDFDASRKVTHWMPLPSAPEKEKNND